MVNKMDLIQSIIAAIHNKNDIQKRDYLGASSIGRPCYRSIWYDYNHPEFASLSPNQKITFDIGKRLEGMILDYIEEAKIKIERPNEENGFLRVVSKECNKLQGHMDGIIYINGKPGVLEIKTANNASFNKFKNSNLRHWNDGYFMQIMAYIGMSKLEYAYVVALNKDTSEIHSEYVLFDEDVFQEIITKAEVIVKANEAPPRINKSPLYFICNMCKYKKVCHSNKD